VMVGLFSMAIQPTPLCFECHGCRPRVCALRICGRTGHSTRGAWPTRQRGVKGKPWDVGGGGQIERCVRRPPRAAPCRSIRRASDEPESDPQHQPPEQAKENESHPGEGTAEASQKPGPYIARVRLAEVIDADAAPGDSVAPPPPVHLRDPRRRHGEGKDLQRSRSNQVPRPHVGCPRHSGPRVTPTHTSSEGAKSVKPP